MKREEKGEDVSLMGYLVKQAIGCQKHYFMAVLVGYLIAIVCTIVVMLVFDHGQPALLYLVPGCILTVVGTAVAKGEFSLLMDFTEDEYITPPDEDEGEGKKEQ